MKAWRTTNAMAGLNSHIYVSNFVFHRCLRKTNLLLLWDYTNRITLNLDLLAYKRFNMQSAKETKLVVITLLKKNQYTYTILHIYFQFFEEVNTLQIQIMLVRRKNGIVPIISNLSGKGGLFLCCDCSC